MVIVIDLFRLNSVHPRPQQLLGGRTFEHFICSKQINIRSLINDVALKIVMTACIITEQTYEHIVSDRNCDLWWGEVE